MSLAGVLQFTRVYAGPRLKGRRMARGTCDGARNALHAWACALRALGAPLQPWRSRDASPVLPPLLNEYCRYRRAHNGVAERTLHRDIETALGFLAQVRHRRKPVGLATLADVDAFVQKVATRVSKGTVADTCSSLRAFLRFLHVTGRLAADLARSVMAPRFRLPWLSAYMGHVDIIGTETYLNATPGLMDLADFASLISPECRGPKCLYKVCG